MAQFESRKQEIVESGGQVVYVAAEKQDGFWNPGKFLERHPISFPFLLDEDRTVTKAYGLHHALGTDALNIAHPATLVIDRQGVVRYIYRGQNQHDRAPLDEVISTVRKIGN